MMIEEKERFGMVSFVIFMFLGLYMVAEFFIILFWTLDFSNPIVLYLTPFFLLGLGPIQLIVLSAGFAMLDAYLHTDGSEKRIRMSFIPSVIMLTGVGMALYLEEYENPLFYVIFVFILVGILADYSYLNMD